jgi:Flp pilus assembly protein TadG
MCPWLLLLFIGIFDFGFYMYAAISVQNAARAAALATGANPASAGSQITACRYARDEMRFMTNFSSLPADCSALPLTVQAWSEADAQGATMSRVQVSYRTVQLFTLPFVPGQMTISRTARMRVFGE